VAEFASVVVSAFVAIATIYILYAVVDYVTLTVIVGAITALV
jgi:hypothetical protein